MRPAKTEPLTPAWHASGALGGARRLLILLAVAGGLEDPHFVTIQEVTQEATRIDTVAIQEFLESLLPATADLLHKAAQAKADALGADVSQLLQFACLPAGGAEFEGTHGTLRRLDRIWGGSMLTEVAAKHELRYRSPLQSPERWLLTRGSVRVGQTRIKPYTSFQLDSGAEMLLTGGSVVLIRQPPLHALIEASQAAGFAMPQLIAAALGKGAAGRTTIATPIGSLELEIVSRTAWIESRKVRLTLNETHALALLCQMPGVVVSRQALTEVLGTAQPRNVDHVIVQLRNKLGDGLITTIYGSGYVLEVARD